MACWWGEFCYWGAGGAGVRRAACAMPSNWAALACVALSRRRRMIDMEKYNPKN